MEERKQKSLQCEIYHRLASMNCARIRQKCGVISFTNEAYEALVIFHENSLMELSIEDRKTSLPAAISRRFSNFLRPKTGRRNSWMWRRQK